MNKYTGVQSIHPVFEELTVTVPVVGGAIPILILKVLKVIDQLVISNH